MLEKVRTTQVAIIVVYILHNIDEYPVPPSSTSPSVSTEIKDIRVFKYEAAVTKINVDCILPKLSQILS